MTEQWSLPAWAVVSVPAVLAVLTLVLAVTLLRRGRRARQRMARQQRETTQLRDQLAEVRRDLERLATARSQEPPEYRITRLGDSTDRDRGAGEGDQAPAAPLSAPLFVDVVLRESAVQAASLARGVRHALSPANRNRISFEMKREVKRARRQRRADIKQALRDREEQDRRGEGRTA